MVVLSKKIVNGVENSILSAFWNCSFILLLFR